MNGNLFYNVQTIQSMESAVYTARLMNGFERAGDVVEAHCISDLLNEWVRGVIQASRDRVYGTAQFYALKTYRDALGSERPAATVQSPQLELGTASVDAIATRSAHGATLFVTLSNADEKQPVEANVNVSGFRADSKADLMLLTAPEPGARNSFSQPHVLAPRTISLRSHESCRFTLPADSVAALTLHRR